MLVPQCRASSEVSLGAGSAQRCPSPQHHALCHPQPMAWLSPWHEPPDQQPPRCCQGEWQPWVTNGGCHGPNPPGRAGDIAPAPPWCLSHSWHHRHVFLPVITAPCHTHGHLFLSAACQAWLAATRAMHPTCLKVHWASSKGTAGPQPWELPAVAMRCWQPRATHLKEELL